MDEILGRLDSVTSINMILERVTDCSILYWHRVLINIYFEALLYPEFLLDGVTVSLITFKIDFFRNSSKLWMTQLL